MKLTRRLSYCLPPKTWQLFVISLVLHVAITLLIEHFHNAVLWENGAIAVNIFEGRGFSAGFSMPNEPTSWQAPAYPYLLAATWSVFGKGATAHLIISILQCIAIASMVWPMAGLSRRWFASVPVWFVQTLVIVAPLYIWYPTRLHHTAFVMALQPWILYAWLAWAGRSATASIGTGVLTGMAALLQPVLLGVFGAIGVSRLLFCIKSRNWKTTGLLILAGMTVVACLVPWTIRNYEVHGRLILVKNSFGKEFWVGNNPHATGTGYALGGTQEVTNAYPPTSMRLKGKVSEMQLMDALKNEAKEWIRANPDSFLKIFAQKVLWFWTLPPKDRVRSTGDAEALVFRGVHLIYWAGLVALSVLGCIVYRPKTEFFWVLGLFVIFYSLIYGLTLVGQARFRGEIEYVFFPSASAGFAFLWLCLTRRNIKTISSQHGVGDAKSVCN